MNIKRIFILMTIILVTIIILPNCLSSTTLADDALTRTSLVEESFNDGDKFINSGSQGDITLVDKETTNIAVVIGNTMVTIAIVVIIVSTLVLGIKYMLATPEEAAKLKKQLIGILISAIIVFMAYTIWSLCLKFFGIESLGEESGISQGGDNGEKSNIDEVTKRVIVNEDLLEEDPEEEIDYSDYEEEEDITDDTETNPEESSNDVENESTGEISSIYLSKSAHIMPVGDTVRLLASVKPTNANSQSLTWESANNDVATVVNGLVSGISEGNTTITVKNDKGREASAKITITEKTVGIDITSLKCDPNEYTIKIGERIQINAQITPMNASNQTLTYTSNTNKVATVDKDGIVTGKAGGTAWVTVKTNNNITDKCRINVVLNKTDIPPRSIKFGQSVYKVEVGKTIELDVTTKPINANTGLTWKTSNKDVASVKNGIVTGVKTGTVVITAKSAFKNNRDDATIPQGVCSVKVVPSGTETTVDATGIILNKGNEILYVGDTLQLIETITPNKTTNKEVEWSSSNEQVATVRNGKVSAIAAGKAIITTSALGSKNRITAKCEITVRENVGDLDMNTTYTYSSSSLKIDQAIFKYNDAECYVNKVWMKSPGNQIKKVVGDSKKESNVHIDSVIMRYAKNGSESSLTSKIASQNPFIAINCEYADERLDPLKTGMDFLSIEEGITRIERHEYTSSQPRHNGIVANSNGIAPFMDVWREEIFKMDPAYTFSASNIPSSAILVKDGSAYPGGDTSKAARNVFAMLDNNTCIILTVKKEGESKGLTLAEIKDLCISLKCRWAINLDGADHTKLYSKTTSNNSLSKLYGGSNNLYSMLYITEYNEKNLAPVYSNDKKDADFPPYESPYLNFVGTNPLSNKIDPNFGKALVKIAKDLGATKTNPLVINSGFRSTEWQRNSITQALASGEYVLNWKGGTTRKSDGQSVGACPGKSKHQRGYAIDIPYTGIADKIRSMSINNQSKLQNTYHLHQPMVYEPWHFQLMDKYLTKTN